MLDGWGRQCSPFSTYKGECSANFVPSKPSDAGTSHPQCVSLHCFLFPEWSWFSRSSPTSWRTVNWMFYMSSSIFRFLTTSNSTTRCTITWTAFAMLLRTNWIERRRFLRSGKHGFLRFQPCQKAQNYFTKSLAIFILQIFLIADAWYPPRRLTIPLLKNFVRRMESESQPKNVQQRNQTRWLPLMREKLCGEKSKQLKTSSQRAPFTQDVEHIASVTYKLEATSKVWMPEGTSFK